MSVMWVSSIGNPMTDEELAVNGYRLRCSAIMEFTGTIVGADKWSKVLGYRESARHQMAMFFNKDIQHSVGGGEQLIREIEHQISCEHQIGWLPENDKRIDFHPLYLIAAKLLLSVA